MNDAAHAGKASEKSDGLRSSEWYLAQAKKAREAAARKRGRQRAALLAAAYHLECIAKFAAQIRH